MGKNIKVLHVNAGDKFGGGLYHIISLLNHMKSTIDVELMVLEDGPVAKAARENNIPLTVLDSKGNFDWRAPRKIKNYINSQQITIVHTHGTRANMCLSQIADQISAKWVTTIHSNPKLDFTGIKKEFLGKPHMRSLRKADYVICVSSEIEAIIQEKTNNRIKTNVILHGVEFSEKPDKHMGEKSGFKLVSAGRLERIKGYDLLIKALSQLNDFNIELEIVGEGSEKEKLIKLIEELNLTDKVKITDWLTQPELFELYKSKDLYVLPSRSESFPIVLLEAANANLPAVATDVGDTKELFQGKLARFLIEPNNSSAIALQLFETYRLFLTGRLSIVATEFRENAKTFGIGEQVEKTLAIYQELSDQ